MNLHAWNRRHHLSGKNVAISHACLTTFQVPSLFIQDKTLDMVGFSELTAITDQVNASVLALENCELTQDKLHALGQKCKDDGIQVMSKLAFLFSA